METKDLIARDIDSLYRKLYISSNSKKELYSRDFSSISILNQMINGIQLDNPFPINKRRLLSEEILNSFEKLYSISLGAIKGYQKMDFKLFEGMDTNLSMSDKKDLLRGFLEYLGSPFLELYRELVNSNRVLFVDEEGIEGEAICLPTLNSYYLCISNYYNQDLVDIETIVHELSHIYSLKFLSNYRNPKYNLIYNFYGETIPLLVELLYYYYLLEHHSFEEIIRRHRNQQDANMLYHYKTIYYLYHVLGMDNISFSCDNVNYVIDGNIHLDHFEGEYYQFGEEYKRGDLTSFNYAVSNIKAHELCSQILNGKEPIKAINEHLISTQYDGIFSKEKITPSNMLEGVHKRNRELRRLYKL